MESNKNKERGRISFRQVAFSELFLLVLASLIITFVLYNLWDLLDLLRMPLGQ